MTIVWVLCRRRLTSPNTCDLTLGIFASSNEARIDALHHEHLLPGEWRMLRPDRDDWKRISGQYMYRISPHPVKTVEPSPFIGDFFLGMTPQEYIELE